MGVGQVRSITPDDLQGAAPVGVDPSAGAAPPSAPPASPLGDDYETKERNLIAAMAKLGHPIAKVSGKRTKEQQASLYAKGRTTPGSIVTEKSGAPGQESKHQTGQASDFAFLDPSGKPDYSPSHPWDTLGRMAKVHGLDWGGDWTTLRDQGHVQQGGTPPPGSPSVPGPAPQETTPLSPQEEQQFQSWATANKITDVDKPGSFYDYRGFWKDTGGPKVEFGKDHFPDTYKQHGHPTFSLESKYSKGPGDGGAWTGDQFVPAPGAPGAQSADARPSVPPGPPSPGGRGGGPGTGTPTSPDAPKPRAITPDELKQAAQPKSGWRQVMDPIMEQAPMVLGATGGMVGGTVGLPTAVASGPAGPALTATLGAWLGGATGQQIRQWYRSVTGQEAHPGVEESIRRAAQSGNAQMFSEMLGQGVGAGFAYRAAGRTAFTPGAGAPGTAAATAAQTAQGASTPATNAANAARASGAWGLRLSAPEISGSRLGKMAQAGMSRISILARIATENARKAGDANAVKAVEDTLSQMTGTLTRREAGEGIQAGVQAGIQGLKRGPIGQAYQAAKRSGPPVDLRPMLQDLFGKFSAEGTTVPARRALMKLLPRPINTIQGRFRWNSADPYQVTFEQAAKLRTRLGSRGRQALAPIGTDATSLATYWYGRLSQTLKAANPAFARASDNWRIGRAAITEPFVKKLQSESAENIIRALGPTPKIDTIRALRATLISLAGHNGAGTPEAQAGVAGWQALRRGWFDRHVLRDTAGKVDPVGMVDRMTKANGVLNEMYFDQAGQRALATARDISNALTRRVPMPASQMTNYIEGLKTMGVLTTALKAGVGKAGEAAAAIELIPGAVTWLMHNPTAAKLFVQGMTSPPSQKGAALVTRSLAGYMANPDYKEDTSSGFEDVQSDDGFDEVEEPPPTSPAPAPSGGGRGGGPGTPSATPPAAPAAPKPTGTSGTAKSEGVTGQVTPPASSEIAMAGAIGTGLPTHAATQTWHLLNTPLLPQIKQAASAIANQIDAPRLKNKSEPFGTTFFQSPEFRGFVAGATEGAGDVAASFTSPIGIALLLSGIGPASKIAKAYPSIAALTKLPQVVKLQRAVQVGAGTAFAGHGAHTAATAPTWGEKAMGITEFAAGAAGAVHGLQGRRSAAKPGKTTTPDAPRPGAAGGPEPPPPPSPAAPGTPAMASGIPVDVVEARKQADSDALLQRQIAAIQGDPREQPVFMPERRKAEGTGPGGLERRNRALDLRDPIEAAKQMREENPNIDAEAKALQERARASRKEAPPREGKIKAVFKGWQPGVPEAGIPHVPLYDIIGGSNHGSTVTPEGLKAQGIEVPETPPFDPAAVPRGRPHQPGGMAVPDWEGIREQFGGAEPGPSSSHDAPPIEPGKVPRWVKFEDGGYWVMPDGEMEFGANPKEAHEKLRARGIEPTGKKGGPPAPQAPQAPKEPQSWQEGQEGLPGFYSRLQRAVSAMPERIKPAKVMETLKKYVGAEELSWKDVQGFIDRHVKVHGAEVSVPKSVLQDYVKSKAITLRRVKSGGFEPFPENAVGEPTVDPNPPADSDESHRVLIKSPTHNAISAYIHRRPASEGYAGRNPLPARFEAEIGGEIMASPESAGVKSPGNTFEVFPTFEEAHQWIKDRVRTSKGDRRSAGGSPRYEGYSIGRAPKSAGGSGPLGDYTEARTQMTGPDLPGHQAHWPERDLVSHARSRRYELTANERLYGPYPEGQEPVGDQPMGIGHLLEESQSDIHEQARKVRKTELARLRKAAAEKLVQDEGITRGQAYQRIPKNAFDKQVPADFGYVTRAEQEALQAKKTQSREMDQDYSDAWHEAEEAHRDLNQVSKRLSDRYAQTQGHMNLDAMTRADALQAVTKEQWDAYSRQLAIDPEYNAAHAKWTEAQQRMNRIHAVQDRLQGEIRDMEETQRQKKPDYPFKDAWSDLNLKQELFQAAKGPAQWFGAVGGEENAARYNLSRQISKVRFDKETNTLFAYDLQGNQVMAQRAEPTMESLSQFVQDDVAARLLDKIDQFDVQASRKRAKDIHEGREPAPADEQGTQPEPLEPETPDFNIEDPNTWTEHQRDMAMDRWRDANEESERQYRADEYGIEEEEIPDPDWEPDPDSEVPPEDQEPETTIRYRVVADWIEANEDRYHHDTRARAQSQINDLVDSEMENWEPDPPDDEELANYVEHADWDPEDWTAPHTRRGRLNRVNQPAWHSEYLKLQPTIQGAELSSSDAGMRAYYDNYLKTRLEKILAPFGGGPVEHIRVPGAHTEEGTYLWITKLTPAMKEQILKAGFSLMATALAIRATTAPQEVKDRFFRAAVLDARRNKRTDLPPGLMPPNRTPSQVLHGRQ